MKAFVTTFFAVLVVACASAPPGRATAPPPTCSGRQTLLYVKTGCGAEAVPECADIPPPCAQQYCGCDGKVYTDFCGNRSSKPIAPDGTCK